MNEAEVQQKRQVKVPDLPAELFKDQYKHTTYTTSFVPPFLCTTESIVTEKYNSDPNLLRSTMYILPGSEFYLISCDVPFALVATPFSNKGFYNEVEGLDRCTQCRTYFNCFTSVEDSSYICNICDKKNSQNFQFSNNLGYSSTEYLASASSKLERPAFTFVFDFSFSWCHDIADTVLSICANEDFQLLYENVIFIVINEGISLFTSNTGEITHIRILGDGIPYISSNVIIKSTDHDSIKKIIEKIKSEKVNRKFKEMQYLLDVLKEISKHCSGTNVALFTSQKGLTYDFEDFIKKTRSLSINIFTEGRPDASNPFHSLAFYTCGSLYSYVPNEINKCKNDVIGVSLIRTVFDLSIVLKLSDNITKTGIIAPDVDENFSSTKLCAMNANSTTTFLLSLNGVSKNVKYAQLQINFTDFDGTKKVRVLNHSFTNGNHTNFYSGLSFDTIFAVLCKMNASDETKIEEKLIKTLVFYRKKCASATAVTQFILPEPIKCLPLLIQSFYKNRNIDKRRIVTMNVEQIFRYFYPRLFSLSEYTVLSQTRNIRLSLSNLDDQEIYIMENGITIYVYIGRSVDDSLLSELFDFNSKQPSIIESDSEASKLLRSAIYEVIGHYGYSLETRVIQASSIDEVDFLSYMVEDSINNACDYIDFIFKIHFQVQKG